MQAIAMTGTGVALAGRLGIGLGQGVALYLLYRAGESETWPATEPMLIAPLALLAVFVPLIVLAGWRDLRPRTLILWAGAAALALIAVTVHDVTWQDGTAKGPSDRSPAVALICAAGLFIAQALVTAGDGERRLLARYPACFDAAWKLAVQLVLTLAFVGTFWLMLYLGTQLFALIGLTGFGDTIQRGWFVFPASAVAVAVALHITDVQPAIVRGIRTLKLTLLSWLLPLMTGMVLVFLASLPFTGLQPLWDTRVAAPILLGVDAALILLINACYQDGTAGHTTPRLLRLAMMLGALTLPVLTAISAYGLSLRVGQHGWTADRIFAAAALGLVGLYAAGYAWAAIRSGTAMRPLETTNRTAALTALALALALFTPIADPARLAVAIQLSRLESGAVTWEAFDLASLRFDNGRYGIGALEKLKAAATDPAKVRDIETVMAALSRYDLAGKGSPAPRPDAETLRANITAHPAGQDLPADFPPTTPGNAADRLRCLSVAGAACDAFLVDLNGDGTAEIILTDQGTGGSIAFTRRDGQWTVAGAIDGLASCAPAMAALKEGKASATPRPWAELSLGGHRFSVTEPGLPVCY